MHRTNTLLNFLAVLSINRRRANNNCAEYVQLNNSGCPSNSEVCGVMYNLTGLFWGGRQADFNSGNTHRTLVWLLKITQYLPEKIEYIFNFLLHFFPR